MESHRVQEMMRLMASKIREIANTISDEDTEKFIRELLNAKRVYVIGSCTWASMHMLSGRP
jgi:6-phospho-3-hexuloisomerase